MFEEYSAAISPSALPGLILKRVWHVKADRSYDVFRHKQGDGLILLRTISGCGELLTGCEHFALTGNTLLIVREDDITRYRCVADDWHFYWLEFCLEDDSLPLSKLFSLHPVSRENIHLDNILSMLRRNSRVDRDFATATFVFLVNSWLHSLAVEQEVCSSHREIVRKVIDRMHERLRDNWAVPDMARYAGMGERNFREVFNNETGYSPKKYYDSLRLDYARALLTEGKCTVQEASDALNFNSPFYFSRAFKRHFGMPPSTLIV